MTKNVTTKGTHSRIISAMRRCRFGTWSENQPSPPAPINKHMDAAFKMAPMAFYARWQKSLLKEPISDRRSERQHGSSALWRWRTREPLQIVGVFVIGVIVHRPVRKKIPPSRRYQAWAPGYPLPEQSAARVTNDEAARHLSQVESKRIPIASLDGSLRRIIRG